MLSRICRVVPALTASVCTVLPLCVQAATPPGGGDIAPKSVPTLPALPHEVQLLPSEAPPGPGFQSREGVTIRVQAIRISGATAFPHATLQALLQDQIGAELDFNGLQALAMRITRYYQAHDYLVARAVLPAQRISNGEVSIEVQEGRLGQVRLDTLAPVEPAAVEPYLAGLHELQGKVLQRSALERELLLLNDLAGVHVKAVLAPGAQVGTTDLHLEVSTERTTGTSLILDNYGNRYTGEYRLTGRVLLANPWQFGDSLDLSATYAFTGYRYARAAWQTPLGSGGVQAGVAGSLMSYQLGKEFAAAGNGQAADLTLYAIKPLQRNRNVQSQGQLALDLKRFDDSAAHSTTTVEVVNASVADRRIDAGGALSSATLGLSAGHLQLDSANAAADAAGHRTAGGYAKLTGSAEHEHPWPLGLSGVVRLSGQWAGKNLDSSEKFALGGPQAVRGYAVGEVGADDAVLGTVELRERLGVNTTAKLFADAARARLAHAPIAGDIDNLRSFASVGIGLDTRLPADFVLQTAVARRSSGTPTANLDRSPRLWLLLAKTF